MKTATKEISTLINNPVELPNFSGGNSINDIFDVFYKFLKQKWNVVELDLFLTDNNNYTNRLNLINSSVSLEKTFFELEERGLLDWASLSNEIKIIQNIDESLKQIKSIIIIPIMFNNQAAFFIANSPLSVAEIDNSSLNTILFVAKYTFSSILIYKSELEKQKLSTENTLLKKQTIIASNQITASEILLALNESFGSTLKIIKANIDFIQKNVGDTKQRIKILSEHFNSFISTQKLIQSLSNEIEHQKSPHNIYKIIEQSIVIAQPYLNKNGVIISPILIDNEIEKISILGLRIQLIFAFFNTIMHSLSNIQDEGMISIGIDKTSDTNRISILISDNGIGIGVQEKDNNLISLIDTSPQKMKDIFLYKLSQDIIVRHQGKFSVFSEEGKGTTYKITFPFL